MRTTRPLFAAAAAPLALLALLAPQPAHAGPYGVELFAQGLDQPVRLLAPAGDGRIFIVERTGRIRLFHQDGSEIGTFLDLSAVVGRAGERGLLGLAFPPDHAATGRFYVNYIDRDGNTRVVRYGLGGGVDVAAPASAATLLTIHQPHSTHNGGQMAFGSDGMLYVGLGDGGGAGDPDNRAQDDQQLFGKMLRLDVSGPGGYAVPADNPFVGQAPLDEIWVKGLRNPWCFSFDRDTGDLYIADVGEKTWEEVDVQPASSPGGENYGWRLMEGDDCYLPETGCNDGSLTLPAYAYDHGGTPFRCSISGGFVYRGALVPELAGQYLFGDYCSAQIWSFVWTDGVGIGTVYDRTDLLSPPGGYQSVVGFGQDGLGELYVLDIAGGTVHRIVPGTPLPATARGWGDVKALWR